MQQSNRSFFHSSFSFPLLVAVWGVFYVLFGEKLSAHDGLGWDGQNYADITRHMLESRSLNSYSATRFLPSAIVHFFLTLLSLPLTNPNIIYGFLILNLVSVVITVYLVKKTFDLFRVPLFQQLAGMILFFFSYCISRFLFYYPVMTDSFSMMLSALLLYSYLSKNTWLLVLTALVSSVTWPIIFYASFFLLVFPFKGLRKETEELPMKHPLRIISAGAIIVLGIYFLYVEKAENEFAYSLKIQRELLPASILILAAAYYFLPSILPFSKGWIDDIKRTFSVKGLLLFVGSTVIMVIVTKLMNPQGLQSGYMKLEYLIRTPIILAVVRPMMFITSHFAFFGIAVIVVIAFWRDVAAVIRGMEWGVVLAVSLTLFWIIGTTESRSMTHLFPWMIVFLVISLRKYQVTEKHMLVMFVLAFAASKIYLQIGYNEYSGYNADGTVAFPNQKFFMNQGPWMSSAMYLLQTSVMIVMAVIVYFLKVSIQSSTNEKKLYKEPSGAGI